MIDTRGRRRGCWPAPRSSWLGPRVRRSDDLGETWQESPDGGVRFPEGTDASVERIWQLTPGRPSRRSCTPAPSPARSGESDDHGETFDARAALWDHPHRTEWAAGFGGQAFHTILPHPTDADSVTVALSTGGVYQTDRRREVLVAAQPRHPGGVPARGPAVPRVRPVRAQGHPPPGPPERLFLQNHGGVYRSDDEGGSWTSIADGLPADFGFPIVVHPHEPDTVFVFPINGGEKRYPPEAKAARLALPGRRRDLGASSATGSRTRSTSR